MTGDAIILTVVVAIVVMGLIGYAINKMDREGK